MTFNISDLMEGLGDETLTLADLGITTPERVLALVRERSGASSAAPARKTKRPRRLGRILLIAAALTALLSATAYAVYELVIDRYVIDQPAPYMDPAATEASANPVSRISLVGYQGTPEYLAFTEWEGLQEKWWTENVAFWQEQGVDDIYHETPDNYWAFYSAVTQEQAEQVDAIMEKYGLTPHTTMATFDKTEALYDALGTESFYTDALAGASNGYIYDDGTFKDEGRSYVFPDGQAVGLTVFVSAKGSFSDISGSIDLSQGYEEWSHTTAGGVTVDLVLTPSGQAEILAETNGAYIDIGVGMSRTQEDLQTIADCIDFAVLAERFDGAAHPETAEKVTALRQQMLADNEAAQAEYEQDSADLEAVTQTLLDELGSYTAAMPEGYANVFTAGHRQQGHGMGWTELDTFDQVSRAWFRQADMASINLDYYRFYSDGSRSGSATEQAFRDAAAYFVGKDHPLTEINGCEGFVLAGSDQTARDVWWYDAAHDLLFDLQFWQEGSDAGLDTDGMLAIAASVAEGTPPPAETQTDNVLPTPSP